MPSGVTFRQEHIMSTNDRSNKDILKESISDGDYLMFKYLRKQNDKFYQVMGIENKDKKENYVIKIVKNDKTTSVDINSKKELEKFIEPMEELKFVLKYLKSKPSKSKTIKSASVKGKSIKKKSKSYNKRTKSNIINGGGIIDNNTTFNDLLAII